METLKIFSSLMSISQQNSSGSYNSPVFSLHYKLTVGILVVFLIVLGGRKYAGTPMTCMPWGNETVQPSTNSWCWTNSYRVVPRDESDKNEMRRGTFNPVINQAPRARDLSRWRGGRFRADYLHGHQWIEFAMIIQALLFLLPGFLWKYCWEDKRVIVLRQTFTKLRESEEMGEQGNKSLSEKEAAFENLIEYLKSNRGNHRDYAGKYVFCEFLNVLNSLGQFLALHYGMWGGISLGEMWGDFFETNNEQNGNRETPIGEAFPNLARCDSRPAPGAMNLPDTRYCNIPFNNNVVRMYGFLCFYFLGLFIISVVSLFFYRFATCVSSKLRVFLIGRSAGGLIVDYEHIVERMNYGEWFVLTVVVENVDPFSYQKMLDGYGQALLTSED